jgi:tetratricopeptide (TPR) repeat protein
MDNLGLNNDVIVGDRKFHVQTGISDSSGTLTANVFDEGQVIMSRSVTLSDDVAESAGSRMKDLHQELITEIEILYYINEKVKTVRHAPSANKLGLLFLQHNLLKEAIAQFEFAHEIDPHMYEVLANLGRAYLFAGSYDKAIAALQKGVVEAPHYADIQNYLGIAHIYKSDYSEAIGHLEKAVVLNRNYLGAYYHLGIAYIGVSLQEPESAADLQAKALSYFHKASERMTNYNIPNFKKIKSLIDDGAYEQALAAFQHRQPREVLTQFFNVEHEFYLKFMYGGKGKDDRFISEYISKVEELIDANPDYADVHNSLGIAHLIQCRNLFLKALDEFRTALKINPDYRKAEKNLKLAENDGKGFLILLRAILK